MLIYIFITIQDNTGPMVICSLNMCKLKIQEGVHRDWDYCVNTAVPASGWAADMLL